MPSKKVFGTFTSLQRNAAATSVFVRDDFHQDPFLKQILRKLTNLNDG
jgi:hypothetical protein